MTFKEFAKSLGNDKAEGEIAKTILISLLTSFATLALLYYLTLYNQEGFVSKYGFYLFFAILSYAVILPSIRYARAYGEFSCMSGMMIGMTIGMISGFLSGFYIGATNGMFWGSLFGLTIGMFFGIWNGKCCGIMGIMEGMMAGFMGGLMGAMTSIMMINDNVKAAGIVVFAVSALIITGLNYMIYKETREREKVHDDDAFFVIFWSLLLTAATAFMMTFGPRSLLFGAG